MAVSNPRDLFLYDLSLAYSSEQTLLHGMKEMRSLAQSDRIRDMIDRQIQDMQRQISQLDEVFREIGQQPRQIQCMASEGLVTNMRMLCGEIQEMSLMDVAVLGVWASAKHLEIGTYRSLTEMARLLGNDRITGILSQILSREEDEARMVEQTGRELAANVMGAGGPGISGISFR